MYDCLSGERCSSSSESSSAIESDTSVESTESLSDSTLVVHNVEFTGTSVAMSDVAAGTYGIIDIC